MIYFKTSQFVPGKGDAWMFYECNDDRSVRRYLTFIPSTREITKVENPFIKKLQNPERLMRADKEEFEQYWPPGAEDEVRAEREQTMREVSARASGAGRKHFDPDMTVGEAMAVHPRVAEVFTAFHLGGCSSCGISEVETVAQVCMGYGVDLEVLLDVLEGLMDPQEAASSQ
jgi:hybrid cluster-associated redox disulfide protein